MKLYELEKGAMFTFAGEQGRAAIKFDHIDGMYSVCYAGEHVVHISANAEVERVEDEFSWPEGKIK